MGLHLQHNQLTSLPTDIGNLTQLQELYLDNNQLTSVPTDIGNLAKLQRLNLGGNQLTSVPTDIGNLVNLEWLYLSNNQLTSVPTDIGNLVNLTDLYLNNNQLTSVPATIANLKNLEILDLRGNPLDEGQENGETMGWRKLKAIFRDRVLTDQDDTDNPTEEGVYAALAKKPIYWCIEELRKLRPDPAPEGKLSGEEILSIWKNRLCRYVLRQDVPMLDIPDEEAAERVANFIADVYDTNKTEALRGWRLHPESVRNFKNMIEATFVRIKDHLDQGDESSALAYLLDISEATKVCTDGQLEALNMVYSALYQKEDIEGSFGDFVKKTIARLKEYVLRKLLALGELGQNVHVVNYWRYRLRDKIGFTTEYKSEIIYGNDPFRNNEGIALQNFFASLTPKYAINELSIKINENPELLNGAGSFMMHEINNDDRYRHRMFFFNDDDDAEYLRPSHIKREGVEDILVKMRILIRNQGSDDEERNAKIANEKA